MIPKHRCSPYCDPDEGVHCLPNTGTPGCTIEDFRRRIPDLDVLKIKEEADVTPALTEGAADWRNSNFYTDYQPGDTQGYLMWVREKE